MRQVHIRETKAQLSHLAETAISVEELIIARACKPKVRLAHLNRKSAPWKKSLFEERLKIHLEYDRAKMMPELTLFNSGL